MGSDLDLDGLELAASASIDGALPFGAPPEIVLALIALVREAERQRDEARHLAPEEVVRRRKDAAKELHEVASLRERLALAMDVVAVARANVVFEGWLPHCAEEQHLGCKLATALARLAAHGQPEEPPLTPAQRASATNPPTPCLHGRPGGYLCPWCLGVNDGK